MTLHSSLPYFTPSNQLIVLQPQSHSKVTPQTSAEMSTKLAALSSPASPSNTKKIPAALLLPLHANTSAKAATSEAFKAACEPLLMLKVLPSKRQTTKQEKRYCYSDDTSSSMLLLSSRRGVCLWCPLLIIYRVIFCVACCSNVLPQQDACQKATGLLAGFHLRRKDGKTVTDS